MRQQKPYTIRQAKSVEQVFKSAMWHLESKGYFLSIGELRIKLARKTDNEKWINQTIEKLLDLVIIKSDQEFAIDYIERSFFADYGSIKIKQVLKKKLIPDDLISDCIDKVISNNDIDEQDIINRYINSYYSDFNVTKEKLTRILEKRGFTYRQVKTALDQHPMAHTLKTDRQVKAEKTDIVNELVKHCNRGKGLRWIKMDLRSKAVDVTNIDQISDLLSYSGEIDFYASSINCLAKKNYDLKDFSDKRKAYAYLQGRGFNSDEISNAIDELLNRMD